ncbi:hypothetical protein T492DRAFT_1000899 [Pavlovales sp. CCMP2436]|nr:hypothetical protein T492DRAFT_1000899 [Pavlovales sp. CCMP2436]
MGSLNGLLRLLLRLWHAEVLRLRHSRIARAILFADDLLRQRLQVLCAQWRGSTRARQLGDCAVGFAAPGLR